MAICRQLVAARLAPPAPSLGGSGGGDSEGPASRLSTAFRKARSDGEAQTGCPRGDCAEEASELSSLMADEARWPLGGASTGCDLGDRSSPTPPLEGRPPKWGFGFLPFWGLVGPNIEGEDGRAAFMKRATPTFSDLALVVPRLFEWFGDFRAGRSAEGLLSFCTGGEVLPPIDDWGRSPGGLSILGTPFLPEKGVKKGLKHYFLLFVVGAPLGSSSHAGVRVAHLNNVYKQA